MRGGFLQSRWSFLTSVWGEGGARLFAAAAVAAHAVAAWFNAGFLSADEHYQIIEYAQYKLGRQSVDALAWEFAERLRPALQPALAALAIRVNEALGVTSPFTIAFSLRLLSATIAIIVALEVCVRCLRPVKSRFLRQAAMFVAFLLWIAPTAHGRFSSENWSGMWLAVGVCLVIDAVDRWPADRRRSILYAAGAGVSWGFAFYFRFQIGLAIAGVAVWLLFVKRAPAGLVAALAIAFTATCGLNVALDHWMYGVWTFSPVNYFRANIIERKSTAFGVAPWWLIAIYSFVALVPPFSFVLVLLLVVGSWRARRDIVVWATVPFVVGHMVVAHKEPRFVIPLLYFLGPWLAICAAALPHKLIATLTRWRASLAVAVAAFCAVNLFALCVTISVPVNDRIALDRWLWDQRRRGVEVVYTVSPRNMVVPANVTNSFYKSGVILTPLPAGGASPAAGGPVFVYYSGTTTPRDLIGFHCRPVFRTYPMWLSESALFRRAADAETDTVCRIDSRTITAGNVRH